MIRFELGDLRVSVLDAGSLWLDGGAMFGVVPRVLWERERPPDERNRIRLAMNVLLVEDGRQTVLVDTGAGTKWDDKSRAIYRLEPRAPREFLGPAGLSPEDIDLVVNSHLHFDHAGGNTESGGDGALRPSFPSASYLVQDGELQAALRPNERTRASYLPDDTVPLVDAGRWRTVDGPARPLPWLELRVAPGHTPHMQVALVVSGGRTLAFLADLVPTASHVRLPYVMAYDLEPLVTLESKRRILPEAHRGRWLLLFEHDDELPLGILEERDGKLSARDARGEV